MTKEEAITIIDNLHLIGCGRNQHEDDLRINVALDLAIEALSERPMGEWNKFDTGIYLCSNCNWAVGNEYNYCPRCGAVMIGGDSA